MLKVLSLVTRHLSLIVTRHLSLIILPLIICFPSLSSCQSRNNPNLSEKRLRELMNDSSVFPRCEVRNMGNRPPSGVKYAEIRSVDPAAPPAIIDIAGNLKNEKLFKLSDIASSVRYIYLQQPPDTKYSDIYGIATDDKHIFINTLQGLFCYSAEGQYLYTVYKNQIEDNGLGQRLVVGSMWGKIDLLNGKLLCRFINWPSINEGVTDLRINVFDIGELDAQMLFSSQSIEYSIKPEYQVQVVDPKRRGNGGFMQCLFMDNQSFFNAGTLSSISLYGDTLCIFNDYDRPDRTVIPRVGESSEIYRINGRLMLQKGHNDTIFRIMPPNRFVPAYVMRWGEYKPDINQHAAGSDLEGKLVFSSLVETPGFIFIRYTEGRDFPGRRNQGKVKDHWAIYDKTAKTLAHYPTSERRNPRMENDLEPVGMPFWPQGLNHKDEMYMTFSKEQLKDYIAAGEYQNDKMQAVYDNMPDDGFCLMIVK